MFGFMLTQIYFKLRVLFCGERFLAGATQKWCHDKLMGVTLLAIDPFQVGFTCFFIFVVLLLRVPYLRHIHPFQHHRMTP